MANIVEQIDDKLGVYVEYLNQKGYDQANLDIILRDKKDAISQLEAGGKIKLPQDLQVFIPIGNPPAFMSAFAVSNGRSYGTIFFSQDTAVNLLLSGPANETTNPLLFIHILRDKMTKILQESRDGTNVLEKEFNELPLVFDPVEVASVNQIDSILYNFLTDRPILIFGPVERSLNILITFLMLIPTKFQSRYGYSINMPYFPHESINFAIVDDLPQYDTEKVVNQYLKSNHSLVNLYENQSFGEFSCSFTQEIVDMLDNENMEGARRIVETIFDLVREVEPNENAQQFGDRKNIAYDNADLVLDIVSKVLGGN